MTVQTTRGAVARINVSRIGSGRDHYHLILSRTTGLNGATCAHAFETLQPAQIKALAVRAAFESEGYVATERQNGAVLMLSKDGTVRYLFVRACNLKHAR